MPWLVNRLDPNFDAEVIVFLVNLTVAMQQMSGIQFTIILTTFHYLIYRFTPLRRKFCWTLLQSHNRPTLNSLPLEPTF